MDGAIFAEFSKFIEQFLEPKASSTAFLLGKVWWPWLEAEVVDSSVLRLMINPGAGQPY